MTKKHATLSASSSDRWMNCPGSIKLSEGIPNTTSVYAQEGSAAHSVAEACLNSGCDAEDMIDRPIKDYPDIECTEEMAEAVQLYLDTVRFDLGQYPHAELEVEMKFDLSHIYPDCFGTNDALIYDPDTKKLIVYDYKHGRGVAVDAKDNKQLMYYATGALTGKHNRGIEIIELVIVQPRCGHEDGPVRRAVLSPLELMDYVADLAEAAERTQVADPVFLAGDWCQFCPAAAICPTLRDKAMEVAKADFASSGEVVVSQPSTFTPEQLAVMLANVDVIDNWVKSLRAYCHSEAENGRMIPGYKLVPKQARRKWIDENNVSRTISEAGVADTDIYSKKVKSPAQMEKVLKEYDFAKAEITQILDPLYEAVSSGTNLVSVNSKRASIKIKAEEEFL
jgi:hypothetical protein